MDLAVLYVPANANTVWETVFTGQKTQPTLQQYQSTEGTNSTQTNQTYNKET